jgi:hypothetical protein
MLSVIATSSRLAAGGRSPPRLRQNRREHERDDHGKDALSRVLALAGRRVPVVGRQGVAPMPGIGVAAPVLPFCISRPDRSEGVVKPWIFVRWTGQIPAAVRAGQAP